MRCMSRKGEDSMWHVPCMGRWAERQQHLQTRWSPYREGLQPALRRKLLRREARSLAGGAQRGGAKAVAAQAAARAPWSEQQDHRHSVMQGTHQQSIRRSYGAFTQRLAVITTILLALKLQWQFCQQ